MVASWTPCESSATVSLSGHWVAARRRRRSVSASSGTLTWKGRIELSSPVADSCMDAPASAARADRVRALATIMRTREFFIFVYLAFCFQESALLRRRVGSYVYAADSEPENGPSPI